MRTKMMILATLVASCATIPQVPTEVPTRDGEPSREIQNLVASVYYDGRASKTEEGVDTRHLSMTTRFSEEAGDEWFFVKADATLMRELSEDVGPDQELWVLHNRSQGRWFVLLSVYGAEKRYPVFVPWGKGFEIASSELPPDDILWAQFAGPGCVPVRHDTTELGRRWIEFVAIPEEGGWVNIDHAMSILRVDLQTNDIIEIPVGYLTPDIPTRMPEGTCAMIRKRIERDRSTR